MDYSLLEMKVEERENEGEIDAAITYYK